MFFHVLFCLFEDGCPENSDCYEFWLSFMAFLRVLADRNWELRRIVWTKDSLYVSPPNSTRAIDTLPLNEIQAVVEMNDEPDPNFKQPHVVNRSRSTYVDRKEDDDGSFRDNWHRSFVGRPKTSIADKKEDDDDLFRDRENCATSQDASLFSRNSTANCVLQVKTVVDSVIAGRTLYLSTRNDANPEQQRQTVVTSLSNAVVIAQRKAQAMSRFQKTQEQVRWLQGSNTFPMCMAALIMMVKTGKSGRMLIA